MGYQPETLVFTAKNHSTEKSGDWDGWDEDWGLLFQLEFREPPRCGWPTAETSHDGDFWERSVRFSNCRWEWEDRWDTRHWWWEWPVFCRLCPCRSYPFAFWIKVPHIKIDEFAATNAEPPERFDQTSIPKIAGAQEQFVHVRRLDVIGRGWELVSGCSHGKTSLKMALLCFCVPKTAHNPSQEVNPLVSIE